MELSVDRERCCAAGMCALTAPEVFDQDAEDGRVLLLDAEPPPGRAAAARQAADVCPSGAIIVIEERGRGSSPTPEW